MLTYPPPITPSDGVSGWYWDCEDILGARDSFSNIFSPLATPAALIACFLKGSYRTNAAVVSERSALTSNGAYCSA